MADCKTKPESEAGFTLLEMLIVIAIIALLAALTTPQLLKYLGRAKADTAQTQLQYLSNALDFYFLDVGSFPSTNQGLESMLADPGNVANWDGPYLKGEAGLIDPWGKPYSYQYTAGSSPVLGTLGADGVVGGEGQDSDLTASPSEF